jgi:hypothetical protein
MVTLYAVEMVAKSILSAEESAVINNMHAKPWLYYEEQYQQVGSAIGLSNWLRCRLPWSDPIIGFWILNNAQKAL